MTKTVNFKVGMTCEGCAGAVTRILKKIEGVQEVKPNVSAKLVEVICEDAVEQESLLNALKKWSATSGKSVEAM